MVDGVRRKRVFILGRVVSAADQITGFWMRREVALSRISRGMSVIRLRRQSARRITDKASTDHQRLFATLKFLRQSRWRESTV